MNYIRLFVNILPSLFLVLLSGCANIAPKPDSMPESVCSSASAESAATLEELRHVVSFCIQYPDIYRVALDKLNAMQMPAPPRITLHKSLHASQVERNVFETSIFFNAFDSYPVDTAFQKLNELIATISNSNATKIDVIILNGGVDRNEGSFKAGDSLGISRANAIRRYLMAAGIEQSRIYPIQEHKPIHENTVEGRQRDRVVEITVVTLRE